MITLQIDSGISRQRIIQYFEQELGLTPVQPNTYQIPGCTITLQSIEQTNTILKMPRTLILFSGEEAICTAQQWQFRMRFLSAGG